MRRTSVSTARTISENRRPKRPKTAESHLTETCSAGSSTSAGSSGTDLYPWSSTGVCGDPRMVSEPAGTSIVSMTAASPSTIKTPEVTATPQHADADRVDRPTPPLVTPRELPVLVHRCHRRQCGGRGPFRLGYWQRGRPRQDLREAGRDGGRRDVPVDLSVFTERGSESPSTRPFDEIMLLSPSLRQASASSRQLVCGRAGRDAPAAEPRAGVRPGRDAPVGVLQNREHLLRALGNDAALAGIPAFYLGGAIYYYALYRARVLPRWLMGWGLPALHWVASRAFAFCFRSGRSTRSSTPR